jgi:hypothetical protein
MPLRAVAGFKNRAQESPRGAREEHDAADGPPLD